MVSTLGFNLPRYARVAILSTQPVENGKRGRGWLSASQMVSRRNARCCRAALPKSPNEKPNIALIGCGGRGRADIKDASAFGNVVAFCDVDENHAAHASSDYPGSKAYKDFRKVMERDDIHIIVTATPDHWHTLVNLAALRAGKDVYSEKPLTLTIDEGKHLLETVKKTNRILQVGSQQRSDPNFRLACELVRNGRIGKLQEVQVVLPAGHREGPFPTEEVPERARLGFLAGPSSDQSLLP